MKTYLGVKINLLIVSIELDGLYFGDSLVRSDFKGVNRFLLFPLRIGWTSPPTRVDFLHRVLTSEKFFGKLEKRFSRKLQPSRTFSTDAGFILRKAFSKSY